MNFKTTLIAGLVYAGAVLFAAEAKFDAKNYSIDFGNKKVLKVYPNGTIYVTNQGKRIMALTFCTETPFTKGCIGNSSCKAPKKYDGGAFCVTECKADGRTNSIITKGMVPYHAKGEKVNALEWTQSVKLLPDGKVDYTILVPIPEGYKRRGTRSTFIVMPTADGYSFDYGYKQMFGAKQTTTNVGKLITTISKNPSDVFTIQPLGKNIFFANFSPRKELRIGTHPNFFLMDIHLVFDFNPKANAPAKAK